MGWEEGASRGGCSWAWERKGEGKAQSHGPWDLRKTPTLLPSPQEDLLEQTSVILVRLFLLPAKPLGEGCSKSQLF